MEGEDNECSGCGSVQKDRQEYRTKNKDDTIPVTLTKCPHCGSAKCCMCDMGDDVECNGCKAGGEDDRFSSCA